MIGYHNASSALSLLILLIGASLLHLSTPDRINTPKNINNPHRDTLPVLLVSEDRQGEDEERRSSQIEGAEDEEELFKGVDPKILAAVLLEALNQSQVERKREGEKHDGAERDVKAGTGAVQKEEEHREGGKVEGADRDRDGRRELELLMAARGKEQEEEERKKAQEEEEKMTEKVTSRTMSQTIQVQAEQQAPGPTGRRENEQGATPRQGMKGPEQGSNEEEEEEEEEEQLDAEELKNLEAMMKEFPRLSTATKREGKQSQRAGRGYSSDNDVLPIHAGGDVALSSKRLRWREETQKATSVPTSKENLIEDFGDGNYAGGDEAPPQSPVEQEMMENDEPEEEDEEVLSPGEEEARAKAEQEEVRRQAAEAQRAKVKEETLADIASDLLLRYMVKQRSGNKKDSSSRSDAVEDKRSDEEQGATEEEEDIDPQTIDQLIEISSKLHLPADDVVDIISDVEEKKKRKDAPPEVPSRRQRPPAPLSTSLSSADSFRASQVSADHNSLPFSQRPSPALSPLKTRVQETSATKHQDRWSDDAKPLAWTKPQQPLSIKSPRPGYPFYRYPSYYQRKLYPGYQPIYFPPPPSLKPRYYVPRPAHTLNSFVGYSVGDPSTVPPRGRYHSWVPPRLRRPPAGPQQKPYSTRYPLPLYPRTYQRISRPRSPARKQFYFAAPAPQAVRSDVYYGAAKTPDRRSRDHLEKYIQQILMKREQI